MPNKKSNRRKKDKTGKYYEKTVSKAVKRLYPNKRVEEDVKRPASITGGKRQIDMLLHHEEGMIDFEAKDYKRNIGINTIASYAFKVEDEQIPHAVMVSNSPYAPTAINAAKHFNSKKKFDIKLTHLIDTDDRQSKFTISQEVLLLDKQVRSLRMGIHHTSIEPISVPEDLTSVILENKTSDRLPAYNVFQMMWNDGVCPSDNGQHIGTLHDQKVVMTDGSVITVAEFSFDYVVETVYKKGSWPLKQASGLYNALDNSFTTNGSVASTRLSVEEINRWPVITKEEADDMKGMVLEVLSELPDTPPKIEDTDI